MNHCRGVIINVVDVRESGASVGVKSARPEAQEQTREKEDDKKQEMGREDKEERKVFKDPGNSRRMLDGRKQAHRLLTPARP